MRESCRPTEEKQNNDKKESGYGNGQSMEDFYIKKCTEHFPYGIHLYINQNKQNTEEVAENGANRA